MMKTKHFTIYLILLILLFLQSCTNLFQLSTNTEEISFLLPDCSFFEQESIQITQWKIEIQGLEISQKYYLYPPENIITINITKNSPLSITATPVTKISASSNDEIIFFMPAGAIYPYDYNFDSKQKIILSWEKGFSAFLMQQLYKSDNHKSCISSFIQSFNWKKMETLINEKITLSGQNCDENDKYFYNPWLCNTENLLENIASKKFTSSLLTNSACSKYELASIDLDCYQIYSSFIPENHTIRKKNIVTIDTSRTNLFVGRGFGLVLQKSSSKNVSSAIVKLPIFLKEL